MIRLDSAEGDSASETATAENLSCGAADHKMLPSVLLPSGQSSVLPSEV